MPITECIICGGDMPEGRNATCSHDCYVAYKVDRWRAERDRKNHGNYRPRPEKLLNKISRVQSILTGKHKRKCDYCKTEFMAVNSRGYYCTPQCAILSGKVSDEYSQRRQPSMPKMPWDK
jgi:hypothetical protein